VSKATIGKKLYNLKRKLAQNTVFTLIPPIYKSEFSRLEVKKFSKKANFDIDMRYFIGRRPIKRAVTAVFRLAGIKYVEVHRDNDYWTQIGQFESKKCCELHLQLQVFSRKSVVGPFMFR
jgi:hypothetical protein